jgi:phospholipase/carboxylesterase
VGGKNLRAEKKSSPPVMLVHGTMDDVVPYTYLNATEQGLKTAEIPVTTVTCPMIGHSIDDRGLAAGLDFMHDVWGG